MERLSRRCRENHKNYTDSIQSFSTIARYILSYGTGFLVRFNEYEELRSQRSTS